MMFEVSARIIAIAILTLLLALPTLTSAAPEKSFDHFATGFPLTGGHRNVECESCHRSGIFRGTPRQCVICHTRQDMASGAVKPANHIPSSNECEACHDERQWGPVRRVDHAAVLGSCTSCHNGSRAEGKPINHIDTRTWQCDECHRTSAWMPARFRHLNVAPGQCASCHNGSSATGRPNNQIHQLGTASTASCDECHSTRGWMPAHYSHTGVAAGTCTTCHNGSTATGKPGNHLTTTLVCDSCHSTRGWLPAGFTHTSPNYPNHGRTFSCTSCHSGTPQSSANAWRYPQYAPTCAGCHYNRFTSTGEHRGDNINNFKDCGRCHSMRKW